MRSAEESTRGVLSIAPRLRAPWRLPFALSAAVVAGAHMAVLSESAVVLCVVAALSKRWRAVGAR
jgi:hypothetical protein